MNGHLHRPLLLAETVSSVLVLALELLLEEAFALDTNFKALSIFLTTITIFQYCVRYLSLVLHKSILLAAPPRLFHHFLCLVLYLSIIIKFLLKRFQYI